MEGLLSLTNFTLIYQLLYAFIAVASLFLSLSIDFRKRIAVGAVNGLTLLLTIALILVVGFRAYNVGTDTGNYYLFNWVMGFESISKFEIIFDLFIRGTKYLDLSFTFFLLTVSFFFFQHYYLGFKNLGQIYSVPTLFLLMIFISLPFSLSISINVIRQGLSLAILFFAYANYLKTSNLRKNIIFFVLAVSIHATAIIPILLFTFCTYFSKRIPMKYFYILFVLGILLSAMNFGILNIAPFLGNIGGGDQRMGYLNNDNTVYQVGFKPQFVAFNTLFLLLSYYIGKHIKSENYRILQKYFILASFIFFMAFQIMYSDRWGLFSWFIIPALIAPAFAMDARFIRKAPLTLLFISIYIFFQFYGSVKS